MTSPPPKLTAFSYQFENVVDVSPVDLIKSAVGHYLQKSWHMNALHIFF